MRLLLVALVLIALLLGAKGMAVHKDLVSERRAIDADWTQVEAALEHRAAITQELTALVRAEAPEETAAIGALEEARKQLDSARGPQQKMQANGALDTALARLMLRVDAYRKLDKSKKYGDLLEALKGAEYQIAVARRTYNEAVEHYNAAIELFPNNVVASVTRLGKVDAYFQTPAI